MVQDGREADRRDRIETKVDGCHSGGEGREGRLRRGDVRPAADGGN